MADTEAAIPVANVTKFVRQLSHDLRNYLNAAELQAAFISEIADDAEVKSELKRLRAMVAELGSLLQKLTSALADVKLTPMTYSARDFMEDLRQKVTTQFPDAADAIEWHLAADGKAKLEIDPQYLQQALLELFDNAVRHRPQDAKIVVTSKVDNGEVVLQISEPKTDECDPARWGREPMHTISHEHYGLGLYRAHRIVAAHGGSLQAQFDHGGGCLISSVRLPLSR